MHDDAVVGGRAVRWRAAADDAKGVLAMHDLDLMAGPLQRAGERLHVDGIASGVVRRVERGNHAEAHQAAPRARSRLSSVRSAARPHVNSAARASARSCSAARSAGSVAIAPMAPAIESGVEGSNSSPASPMSSGTALTALESTGVPQAMASIAGSPKPSANAGMATASAAV